MDAGCSKLGTQHGFLEIDIAVRSGQKTVVEELHIPSGAFVVSQIEWTRSLTL